MELKKISELMQLNGWSRAQLARQLGCCENLVKRWYVQDKRYARRPTTKTMAIVDRLLAETKKRLVRQWQREEATA